MAKRKLFKYAQLLEFNNVYQYAEKDVPEDFELKGKWKDERFGNDNPIVLELGCGKGEYTNAMAAMFPDKNFIGIDFKGDRLWAAARSATEQELPNAVFVRTQIQYIEKFFAPGEVSEIWITFPDPQLQKPRQRKRLTAPAFLKKYANITNKNALVHLKTDNIPFFEDTVEVLNSLNQQIEYITRNVYTDAPHDELLMVKTHYEKMFSAKGANINYLRFRLNL